jgi:cysteine synthase A
VDRPGGISAIGGTPVVRLARIADDSCAEVWVKLEAANPTGSYKDRMALAMIEAAEADGRLRPGQLVVEYTGGSTGSSLAFVCAVKDYPLRIVSSDAFAAEKIRTMRAFGAEVELIPSPDGITPDLIPSMMRRAAEIAAETEAFATDQFNDTDMVDGYRRLGEELLGQLPGPPPITAFWSAPRVKIPITCGATRAATLLCGPRTTRMTWRPDCAARSCSWRSAPGSPDR